MKHLLICLGIVFSLFSYGHAQSAEQSKKSTEIMAKMRQVDLLTQLIPLALKKDQINKMLPVLERIRAKWTQMQKDEADALAKLDGKLSDAIKKSIETEVAPPKSLLEEFAKETYKLGLIRQSIADENTDTAVKMFKDVTDVGQQKAAQNSLAPQLFDPSLKPDKMTDDEKLRFFIQNIILDPQTYDVLVQMEKHVGA